MHVKSVIEKLTERRTVMLNWSLTFLVVGLIAGVLGLTGLAGAATHIAWVLFVVFLALFLIGFITGRKGIGP